MNKINKKNIYLIASILFFLLALSFFLISKDINKESKKEENKYISEMTFLDSENFILEDNLLKAEKISFIIPDNWLKKKEKNKISFYSEEIDFEDSDSKIKNLMNGSCIINFQVGKGTNAEKNQLTIAESISKMIETLEYQDAISEEETLKHELFFIDNIKGLKTTFNLEEAKYIIVEIPFLNNIYIFESDFIFTENCEKEFNQILNTIKIE